MWGLAPLQSKRNAGDHLAENAGQSNEEPGKYKSKNGTRTSTVNGKASQHLIYWIHSSTKAKDEEQNYTEHKSREAAVEAAN